MDFILGHSQNYYLDSWTTWIGYKSLLSIFVSKFIQNNFVQEFCKLAKTI